MKIKIKKDLIKESKNRLQKDQFKTFNDLENYVYGLIRKAVAYKRKMKGGEEFDLLMMTDIQNALINEIWPYRIANDPSNYVIKDTKPSLAFSGKVQVIFKPSNKIVDELPKLQVYQQKLRNNKSLSKIAIESVEDFIKEMNSEISKLSKQMLEVSRYYTGSNVYSFLRPNSIPEEFRNNYEKSYSDYFSFQNLYQKLSTVLKRKNAHHLAVSDILMGKRFSNPRYTRLVQEFLLKITKQVTEYYKERSFDMVELLKNKKLKRELSNEAYRENYKIFYFPELFSNDVNNSEPVENLIAFISRWVSESSKLEKPSFSDEYFPTFKKVGKIFGLEEVSSMTGGSAHGYAGEKKDLEEMYSTGAIMGSGSGRIPSERSPEAHKRYVRIRFKRQGLQNFKPNRYFRSKDQQLGEKKDKKGASKSYCKSTPCKDMGFTQKASCKSQGIKDCYRGKKKN